FAMLDAYRTARMIRSGLTPDIAEDIFVKRFSGNPKLWGIVLTIIGGAFLLQTIFDLRGIMRGILPAMLIGLGVYILRGYIFKTDEEIAPQYEPTFVSALSDPLERSGRGRHDDAEQPRQSAGGWKNQY